MLSQSVLENIHSLRAKQNAAQQTLFTASSITPGLGVRPTATVNSKFGGATKINTMLPAARVPSTIMFGQKPYPSSVIKGGPQSAGQIQMKASIGQINYAAKLSVTSSFLKGNPLNMKIATPAPNVSQKMSMMADIQSGIINSSMSSKFGFAQRLRQNQFGFAGGVPRNSMVSRSGASRMVMNASVSDEQIEADIKPLLKSPVDLPNPIKRLMCCNRGEIAIRVFRCCKENGITSIAVYSEQDKLGLHRFKADEAYQVTAPNGSPVQAYLSIDEIINIAIKNKVDAIHPGYGFLSENAKFAKKCKAAGIIFVGPNPETITEMGDKTAARRIASEVGVPIIPGTDEPIQTKEEAYEWCKQNGLPVMMKAAMGGGGRGMRVVRKMEEVNEAFERCSSEALTAFGDGSMFIERLIEKPRHIEVQILADSTGDTVHLYDRDCSVQRRHQKVVEIAPASGLNPEIRQKMLDSAVKLCKHIGYKNAGTVEFLVENDGRAFYFIEVNPRVQVEHTVTEEVCGVDIVQTQIMIAGGATLKDLNIIQEKIHPSGHAIQCRVTTEDPKEGFKPDTGRIGVFRTPGGMGVRLDGMGHEGAEISPYYDSLLTKVICKGRTFESAAQKLYRSLDEFRVRGVKTNISFVKNVLSHPKFHSGIVDTSFIDETPELFEFDEGTDVRLQRVLQFLGEMAINGNTELTPNQTPIRYAGGIKPGVPKPPVINESTPPPTGWRHILLEQGPKGFAQAIRKHDKPLIMDTTWRDAHQSLLATRVRTQDLTAIAPATARAIPNAFSLEMWGGATFDVSMRFLKEDPWVRLRKLRKLVPNIPFQMLIRGANAVGYTSYPDNTVKEFCKEAAREGIDIFRVFDSLNYIENLKFGIEAAREAGGVVEATICYTGDIFSSQKYNLEYYLTLARQLEEEGIDILAIKDMAGLLKPEAAKLLVGTLRKEFPNLPIHIHTHDTAGTGAASMLAAVEAGADIVDGAIDCLSNSTSQPAIGTLAALLGKQNGIIADEELYRKIDDYWAAARKMYAPFETGTMASATDVYNHEMPGGQVTNLRFQAEAVGLGEKWDDVKKAYAMANMALGDIIKVTPSSKVVGDLALFMVSNDLDDKTVVEKAESLDFPDSVLDFMNGRIGVPAGGFPEPFRTRVLKGNDPTVPDGSRPGIGLKPYDFDEAQNTMRDRLSKPYVHFKDMLQRTDTTEYFCYNDLVSSALYPDVHRDFMAHLSKYTDTSVIPTPHFFSKMQVGETIVFTHMNTREVTVKLVAIGNLDDSGHRRVFFEVNGLQNSFDVLDRTEDQKGTSSKKVSRDKADPNEKGHVGCSMKGLIVDVLKNEGDMIEEGEPIAVLSAMKMESVVSATVSGKITKILAKMGDALDSGDLIAIITKSEN